MSLQHPLELKPGLTEAAAHAGHPAVGAVQLYHVSTARLVMQLVHILGDQTAHLKSEVIIFGCTPLSHLPPRLPLGQSVVVGVGEEARPPRPPDEVPGPVALARLGALHEHHVLDWSLGRGGVGAHALAPIVRDPTLSGDPGPGDDQ